MAAAQAQLLPVSTFVVETGIAMENDMRLSKRICCLPLFIGALVLNAVTVPAATQKLECSDPEKAMLEIELIFGRNIDGEVLGVTDASWDDFVDEKITPQFPAGFTIISADGEWLSKANVIVREQSKLVRIFAPTGKALNEKIDSVVTAYRKRFKQESVAVAIGEVLGLLENLVGVHPR